MSFARHVIYELADCLRENWYDLRFLWRLGCAKRIDPAEFPEDVLPVWCMQCGYELRALPEPRCPECGTPFDRGELLVEQYARMRRPQNNWFYWAFRMSLWAGIAAQFIAIGSWSLIWLVAQILGVAEFVGSIDFAFREQMLFAWVGACAALFLFSFVAFGLHAVLWLIAIPKVVRRNRWWVWDAWRWESRRLWRARYHAGRKDVRL